MSGLQILVVGWLVASALTKVALIGKPKNPPRHMPSEAVLTIITYAVIIYSLVTA